MKFVVLGDVHNRYDKLRKYIEELSNKGIDIGFQVGDMGFDPKFTDYEALEELKNSCTFPVHWIDGNHDDHSILQYVDDFNSSSHNILGENFVYQKRGSFIEVEDFIFFFIGGARSVDKTQRIIDGLDWYPEEEIMRQQEEYTLDNVDLINKTDKKVIVFSHTYPQFDKVVNVFEKSYKEPSWQEKFLREVLERLNNPTKWFHGHIHTPVDYKISGFNTEFYSLGALFGKNKEDKLPFYKIIEV